MIFEEEDITDVVSVTNTKTNDANATSASSQQSVQKNIGLLGKESSANMEACFSNDELIKEVRKLFTTWTEM